MIQNLLPEKVINRRRIQARRFNFKKMGKVISNVIESLIGIIDKINKRGKLHGIDHFVNKRYHPLERFLWLLLVIAATYCVFIVGSSQMERYRANPTVISLERGTFIAP